MSKGGRRGQRRPVSAESNGCIITHCNKCFEAKEQDCGDKDRCGTWLPRQGADAVAQKRGGWIRVEEGGCEFQKSFGSGPCNTGNGPGMRT